MEWYVVGGLVAGVVVLAGRVWRLEREMVVLWTALHEDEQRLDDHAKRLRGEAFKAAVLANPGPVPCGPGCRTEPAAPPGEELSPWCVTHHRWWRPEPSRS